MPEFMSEQNRSETHVKQLLVQALSNDEHSKSAVLQLHSIIYNDIIDIDMDNFGSGINLPHDLLQDDIPILILNYTLQTLKSSADDEGIHNNALHLLGCLASYKAYVKPNSHLEGVEKLRLATINELIWQEHKWYLELLFHTNRLTRFYAQAILTLYPEQHEIVLPKLLDYLEFEQDKNNLWDAIAGLIFPYSTYSDTLLLLWERAEWDKVYKDRFIAVLINFWQNLEDSVTKEQLQRYLNKKGYLNP
jgi:hypothetical protein